LGDRGMKIKYRKNENWGMISFRTLNENKIEELIRENLLKKEKNDIDIIDIKIEIDDEMYVVHVFYAREENG
jgi:hypothetical protein